MHWHCMGLSYATAMIIQMLQEQSNAKTFQCQSKSKNCSTSCAAAFSNCWAYTLWVSLMMGSALGLCLASQVQSLQVHCGDSAATPVQPVKPLAWHLAWLFASAQLCGFLPFLGILWRRFAQSAVSRSRAAVALAGKTANAFFRKSKIKVVKHL